VRSAARKTFRNTDPAAQNHIVKENDLPEMTMRFSPHTEPMAATIFKTISNRIKTAESDVLFAIEAIRLVDHFSFRDRIENTDQSLQTSGAATAWYASYYDPQDLHFVERTLMISAKK